MPHLFDHFLVLWTVKVLAGLLVRENVLIFNPHLMPERNILPPVVSPSHTIRRSAGLVSLWVSW